ncbi:MAG TPA: AraC family transcriptional regulator [Steroidobacteraceae bacterium]
MSRSMASLPRNCSHSLPELSSGAGNWTSLLLRRFEVEANADEIDVPPVPDQLIVLLKKGGGDMERFSRGSWQRARKIPGSITLTAPHEATRLRWSGKVRHQLLHVRVPAATMNAAAAEMRDRGLTPNPYPHLLLSHDSMISPLLLALEQAIVSGAPDLYAESAAHLLALHLLSRECGYCLARSPARDSERVRRVDEFMQANLEKSLSLASLAKVAGCSTFRLIRLCKSAWGESPFQRLTRLRMERGQQLLRNTDADILTVAFECGYSNPSHFATAFRRIVGSPPTAFRRE